MPRRKKSEHRLEEHFLSKKASTNDELGTVSITGYVGKCDARGYTRIYQDLRFDEYVEVPEAEIIQVTEVPEDELQFGGTRLWVSSDTKLRVKRARERKETITARHYFKGEVADRFIQATRGLKYDWVGKREMMMLGSSRVSCFQTCVPPDGPM